MSRLEDLVRDSFAAHEHEAPPAGALLRAVHRRAARRRQREWATAGLAAAVVAALVVGLTVLLPGRGDGRAAPAVSPSPLSVPAGLQPVSFHGAQVLVPASWKVDDATCGTPQHDTVLIEDGSPTRACRVAQPAGIIVVRMTPADTPLGTARAALATQRVSVDGQPARRGSGIPAGQRGPLQVLLLPSVNVVISVESPDPARSARILDSARLAVPVDAYGCPDQRTSGGPPVGGTPGTPTSLVPRDPVRGAVCLYRDGWLDRSVGLSRGELTQLVGALRALFDPTCRGPVACPAVKMIPPRATCSGSTGSFLVQLTDAAGARNEVDVHFDCPWPYAAAGGYVTGLSNQLVRLLAAVTGYAGQVPDPKSLP